MGPNELANACGVTAVGYFSLPNDTGSLNTAVGLNALFTNTSGAYNSGFGANSLYANTTGSDNTATGATALYANTTGANNTASGATALHDNTTGTDNNAMGVEALFNSTTASENNAIGYAVLFSNTTGAHNNAIGSQALYNSTTGSQNDAHGYFALYNSTTGNSNVAIGYEAGYYQTTGSNNIYLANTGVAAESGTVHIGTAGTHTATYVAGITGTVVTGAAVYVTTNGKLGVLASSERYKTAITTMGPNSAKLQQLRPVSFHLKGDPRGALQYGLIAEEVEKVYPELVIRDEAGKIQGVHYEELAPLLLNEFRRQQREMVSVIESNAAQAATIATQTAEIGELKRQQEQMRAALLSLQAKEGLVAQR